MKGHLEIYLAYENLETSNGDDEREATSSRQSEEDWEIVPNSPNTRSSTQPLSVSQDNNTAVRY